MYAIAKKTKSIKPAIVRPAPEKETDEAVLPPPSPASSPKSFQIHSEHSKSSRKDAPDVVGKGSLDEKKIEVSDEDKVNADAAPEDGIMYEEIDSQDDKGLDVKEDNHSPTPSNADDKDDDEDDDVYTEQDDDDISEEFVDDESDDDDQHGGKGANLSRETDDNTGDEESEKYEYEQDQVEANVSRETSTGDGDEESEDYGQDGYEDEDQSEEGSEEEDSGREGVIAYEEEIELPPKGADVEALGLISEGEKEEDAPHDEVDELELAPSSSSLSSSLPSAPPKQVVQVQTSPESCPQEEAIIDPVVSKSKTKIGMRLTQALDAAPTTKNRSPELVPLTKDYDVFRKRLRALIAATKKYHQQTKQMEQARLQVVKEFSILSENTPLFDHVGKRLGAKQLQKVEKLGADSLATSARGFEIQNKSVTNVVGEIGTGSMVALEQLASIQATINLMEYQRHVIDYAVEWEQVITSRIDKEIKEVNKLRQDRSHYEKKVDGLRNKVNALESKGKPTPDATSVKLTRNEEKLREAWESHETSSGRLVVLIEEAVKFGWKDLYPIVKNAMKWEVNRVARENETYGRLPLTLEAMKSTVKEHVWVKPAQSASMEEV